MSTATISPRQLATSVVVAASDSKENWRASWDATLGRYLQCDGTADQVEILAAIATVVAAGGGEVVLLEGTYTVSASIAITSSNLTIRGQGRATIITTNTADLDIITCIGADLSELTNIILRDFLVDGNAGGVVNDMGIFWDYVDDSKIINVTSQNNGEFAFSLDHCDNDECENDNAINTSHSGFSLYTCTWVKVVNAVCFLCTLRGIEIRSSADLQLIAPTCYDCGGPAYAGILLRDSDRIKVVGAQCDANGGAGLHIHRSSRCSVIGGEFNNNGGAAPIDGDDGITIEGLDARNADYNVILGIVATGNLVSGIEISEQTPPGQANKNSVVSCNLLGNTGANFVDGGTGTVTGHNVTA